MTPEQRAQMQSLAEGQSTGSSSVELTVDDLFTLVDGGLSMNLGATIASGPYGSNPYRKALSGLEGLAKCGYDKADLDQLRAFFELGIRAEDLFSDASRAMSRLRDEYHDDKSRSSRKTVR